MEKPCFPFNWQVPVAVCSYSSCHEVSVSYDTTNSSGEDDGAKSRHALHWIYNSSGVLVLKNLGRCLLVARGPSFVVDPAFKLWAGDGVDWASRGLVLGGCGGAWGAALHSCLSQSEATFVPKRQSTSASDVPQPFIRSATVKRCGGAPCSASGHGLEY